MERRQEEMKDLGELIRQVEHHAGTFHLPCTFFRSGEKGKNS